MVIKPFKFFLLLCLLFSFIISQKDEIKKITIDTNGASDSGENSKTFQLEFTTSIKGYVHIKISPTTESKLIVYTSKRDEKCERARSSLAKNPDGPINLFLKENQGSSEYLCVQCLGNSACRYDIDIKLTDKCYLPLGEQYSYYVNDFITKMEFEFQDSINLSLRKLISTENIRVNFWVKGQSNPQVNFNFENLKSEKDYGFGKICSAEYDGDDVTYPIEIIAEIGDYITVGSLYIEKDKAKDLEINNFQMMGMLTKDDEKICFPIKYDKRLTDSDVLRVNGNIYPNKAHTYLKIDGTIDEVSKRYVENGLIQYLIYPFGLQNSDTQFCIEHSNTEEIIFSIQLTSPSLYEYNQFIYPPHLPGVIYSHYLVKGEIAVFQGGKPNNEAKEINLNMKARKGFPIMHFDRCMNYPNCEYDKDSTYYKDPYHSNRMTVYSFYLSEEEDFNAISTFQPLMIVHCLEGEKEEEAESYFCQFETSIFTDKDRLHLFENQTFSQYLLKDEKDLYSIIVPPKQDIIKVNLDLIIFSGDVDFENIPNVKAVKSFLSNKISYCIEVNEDGTTLDFNVKAQNNSFYLIVFQYIYEEKENDDMFIESGVNYIQTIDVNSYKYFNFKNMGFAISTPFLVSFFSQNCEFSVSRTILENETSILIDELPIYDSYSQIIIDIDDPNFYTSKHNFKVNITETDKLKKDCLLYVTGLELINTSEGSENYISVADGVTQYYIFTSKYYMIKYAFHVSDFNNAVILGFKLIDKASYKVQISFGSEKYTTVNIFRDDQIFLLPQILKNRCPEEKEVCTININIELENKFNEISSKLETTVYQINGAPIYLEKNAAKQDILFGNEKKYYYIDIENNEVGDITIDYKRGSGYIYAKVVKKNEKEENPDWRGMYRFLKEKGGLKYETYLKKIEVNYDDTKDCEEGCYILLTVENSVHIDNPENDEKKALTPFRISIIPRLIKSEYYLEEDLVPKVKIKVDDYIIGNLFPSTKKVYEFFEVNLPYDSDFVYIDWQADKSSLLVNVGHERPKMEKKDFIFERKGFDTVFKIAKDEILNLLDSNDKNKKENTLKNIHLSLGIHNDEVDSFYTSVYTFKIFLSQIFKTPHEELRIINIRSDQKVQCEPFSSGNNQFGCFFAVLFDEGDNGNNLIVYPRALEQNVELSFKASLVNSIIIENNNITDINEYNRNIYKEYNSAGGKKFLYIENIDRNKGLLFMVYVDKMTNIEVLSSTYKFTNNQVFVPNPSSAQIFAIGENTIEFNFETTQDLLVNIVSLTGEGEFYWNTIEESNIKYFLNGYEDRLTLTTKTKIKENQLSHLIVVSNTLVGSTPDQPGFVFYMTFYPRNDEYNIDQLRVGRSIELNYRDAKFPLNYFAPLSKEELTISFTFYNYYMDSDDKLIYDKELYDIWLKIVSEEDAYRSRFDESYRPSKTVGDYISGIVDGPFAYLSLTSEDFNKLNYDDIEYPTLFIAVDMNRNVQKDFKQLGVEVTISRENNLNNLDYFVPENVYFNDKLSNKDNPSKFIYKLRIDRNKPYMKIEFASNNEDITMTLSYYKDSIKKPKGLYDKYENGKEIYIIQIEEFADLYVYLTVSSKTVNTNPKLTNYVFKYNIAEKREHLNSFKPENDDLSLDNPEEVETKKKYSISFSPIEHYDVSYFIKGVYLNNIIDGEKKDSIAISESLGFNIQLDNPKLEKSGKIKVDFEDMKQEIGYIKVLAKVNDAANKEFLLYKPLIVKEDVERQQITPSEEVLDIYYDSKTLSYKGKAESVYNIQKYRLNFNNRNEIPDYIKFELTSLDNINKVISFTPTDIQGKTDRIQLAQLGLEDKVKTWIKKEQLESGKIFFYIVVECQIEDSKRCSYLMDISGEKNIVFDSPTFNFNYYVNNNNEEMKFRVYNDGPNRNQILSLYATGGKTITLSGITNNGESIKGENILIGEALTTNINSFEYFDLTIEAEEGDYISLGSKIIIDGETDKNILKSNGYQLTGLLTKNVLEKECYTISVNSDYEDQTAFIVGLFYNKEGKIYYKDKDSYIIEEDSKITTNGYYRYEYIQKNSNKKYICVTFPDKQITDLVYTLQLIQPGKQYGFSNLFVPQSNGNIYPRILEKGSYTFFNGINLNSNSEEIIYNMMAKKGLPTMYISRCDNYPLCEFDKDFDTKINDINLMSTWHSREKTSPIEAYQYVMFVKCEDLDDSSQTDICEFYTSIYGNLDGIFLIEGKTFSQYILEEKYSQYYIDISGEPNAKEIHLDVLIINGDISIEILNDETYKTVVQKKYILSNKIFYTIHRDANSNLKRLLVTINAKMNSYYIIEYKLIRNTGDEPIHDIYTGINYLIPILKGSGNEKIINIHNTKLLNEETYYTSFYSLNCKFELNRIENGKYEQIISSGNYGEDTIENKETTDEENVYSYQIKLKDNAESSYNGDMCMVYVSSVELMEEKNYLAQKEILVTEGIPQRILFKKRDYKIKFIYPNVNKDKDATIYFEVINSANFSYTIEYNNNKNDNGYFSQSKLLYINQNKINENCEDGDLCNIIVSIGLAEEVRNNPMIEITIREIGNIPYYLPIGVAKKDFLSGVNKLNLFTTLGKNDQGFVTVDFARGSGLVYAKIVPIEGYGDDNPEWRQYELPKAIENNLAYDFYNKKLTFKTEHTQNCKDGCYLLLSIESSDSGSLSENFRSFQLSITVNLVPQKDLKDNGPIIQIQPEQYIVGSLTDKEKMKNNDMYEFYQVSIPLDAKKVEIDWQSDSATLLLNEGEKRPLISDSEKFESRNDTVFEVDISKNSVYLTLGVYSDILESPYGNSYSFRVHFKKDLNIYKVDSDQKTLCKPDRIDDNEYRCLFMVIYEEFDFIYDTMIYAKSQSLSASTYMYGKFIGTEIYDNFDKNSLEENIPGENSKYNTKRDRIDFIFLTLPDLYSHFYVSVISDKPDIIEFISSFKTFDNQLSPNPSSVQLFAVNNDPSINLKFRTTKPLLINIVSLYGSIKLHFKDDDKVEYFLRGRDDRISLAIPNDGNEENLIIENPNYNEEDKYIPGEEIKTEMPGIAFYLEYFLRPENLNFDEISIGKTSEMVYKKSDFPIYYYSKLNNKDKDINVFFNFHDVNFTYSTSNKIMSSDDLSLKANIIPQRTVYNIKTGAQSRPNVENTIEGKFDPALQAGYLYLPSDYLDNNFENITNPTLYLSFGKKNNDKVFNKIRLELTVAEKNSEIPVTEKIYQYGNIKGDEIVSYKLKVDNYTGYMRIQFSANSRNLDFALSDSPNKKNNLITGIDKKEERGLHFFTFNKPNKDYIYMNVFAKDAKTDSKLNNYVFKYINAKEKESFYEYKILNEVEDIKTNLEKSVLTVKFNRIENKNVDVTYSLKISKKWGQCKDELNKTIAFTENSPTVVQAYNPSGDGIIMKYDNFDDNDDLAYIEIIAQIKDGPIIEYVAYNPVIEIKSEKIDNDDKPIEKKDEDDDDDDDKKIIIAVVASIGSAILIILIALVFIIFIYNRKTKDLLQQVNKISFSDTEAKDKNENLLLDDNELK